MDMTDDVRAALAALDDMTREACAAYDAAAAEYERASMAAALTLVRRALAAEAEVTRLARLADTEAAATRAQWRADDETIYALRAEVTRLRAENDALRKSTDAAVDGVRAMLPEALKVAREEGAADMRVRCADLAGAARRTYQRAAQSQSLSAATREAALAKADAASDIADALAGLTLNAPAEVKP